MKKKNKQEKAALIRLLGIMSSYKLHLILLFVCAIISSISSVLSTMYLGSALDTMLGKDNVDFRALSRIIIILAILFLSASLFQWFVSLISNYVSYHTAETLRKKMFAKFGKLPLSYFDRSAQGDMISRFTNDLDNVSDALSLSIVSLFMGIVIVISSLIIMLMLNVQLALTILLCTPLVFIAGFLISKFTRKTYITQQATVGNMSAFVSEMVGNQKLVKAFGYEDSSIVTFETINQSLFKTATRAQFASAIFNPITRFIDHISYLLVGLVGSLIAISSGATIGMISQFLIYSSQFAKPFNEISGIMSNIQTGIASLKRVFIVIDATEEKQEDGTVPDLKCVKGAVEFKNVDFSYTKGKPLIQNFNLKVAPGSTIAIVGSTGAGKTTLVNLLMRFYELNGGAIYVDGQDASQVTRDSLRRSFGMVLQDTWIFAGTIRENIAYGKPDATDEEVVAAAKAAHAHSFIRRMPNGYDSLLEQDGGNLSEGQKQLLTIARIMLTDPEMLILDEATSSIDTLTEIRIQKTFLAMMQGRTSFVIAHRLSTIASADMILVMDKGNVVETGNHNELLAAGGLYAQLYHSQFEPS
ncbi:ABC transporter ATP-binding protein [Scatolibacter rhodanostii]|uniref:ABC transporter ATP-binding protein n=1 Tax=Scatolibacter rhodanostii TaxID=2014781 RepID=UPI000C07F111|nr:ABC transporter ATP-binding protein [Scatolibacter rhodanostii]